MKNFILIALFSTVLIAGCLGFGGQPTPTPTPVPTIEPTAALTPTPTAIATATPAPTPVPVANVSIINRAFKPSVLEISAGTKVAWKNEDGVTYTIIADDKSFQKNDLGAGGVYEYVFSTPGEYKYSTERFGFSGTIKVS
ncbi:hypothetical protein HY993_02105 [Candidatus Micrarchaeota archaeon]|nr:hypothetical protein [Candidatus Micrarchaeota archaeon]